MRVDNPELPTYYKIDDYANMHKVNIIEVNGIEYYIPLNQMRKLDGTVFLDIKEGIYQSTLAKHRKGQSQSGTVRSLPEFEETYKKIKMDFPEEFI